MEAKEVLKEVTAKVEMEANPANAAGKCTKHQTKTVGRTQPTYVKRRKERRVTKEMAKAIKAKETERVSQTLHPVANPAHTAGKSTKHFGKTAGRTQPIRARKALEAWAMAHRKTNPRLLAAQTLKPWALLQLNTSRG